MSPAYLLRAPAGVEGDVTRTDESNVEPAMLVAASGTFAQKFGIPMKYVTGGIQQFNGGAETPESFAGVLIREVPAQAATVASDESFDAVVPNPLTPKGMMVRGYVAVKCTRGTPARGGAVFVQIVANGGVAVGDFAATDDGGNAIELTAAQATWASDGKDSDNNAELRIAR